MSNQTHTLTRRFWILLGFFFVGLGILGTILPLMPGLVFFIIASYCFAKGSYKFLRLLLSNKQVGPAILDWKRGRGMTVKTKTTAISMASVSMIGSALFLVKLTWVKYCILCCLIIAVSVILSVKTKVEKQ
jgi:hypothetical protein